MLRQLLENQLLNLQILVDECERIIDDGIRLPLTYWRGARVGFSVAAYDLCCVLDEVSDDDQLIAYLNGLTYAWVEQVIDLHDAIGESQYAGDEDNAIYLNGKLGAYAQAYRETSQLVEDAKGRDSDDAVGDG